MNDQLSQINFNEYLQLSDNSDKSSEDPPKVFTEEDKVDEDRNQRINDLFKQYESKAKESEELLRNSNIKESQYSLNEVSQCNLGDYGQFVKEMNDDVSLNKENLIEKKKSNESLSSNEKNDKDKKITINLFEVQQAELTKKAVIYNKRKMSPASPVHERLFANAMEKNAKTKLKEVDMIKKKKSIPLANKVTNELMKDRNPEATPDVNEIIK